MAKKSKKEKQIINRYNKIADEVVKSSTFLLKVQKARELISELNNTTQLLNNMNLRYEHISQQNPNVEELTNALPIESLKDSLEDEIFGKTSKLTFNDIVIANQIKEDSKNIVLSKSHLVTELRQAQMDYLIAKIEAILEVTKDETY